MFYESFWIESRWYLCISICIFLHTYIAICVCIYMNIYVKTLGGEGCLQDSGVPGSTLASASWSNSPIMLYSPWCQCTQTCSHVSFIKNNIYTPVPGVSSPVGNRSCPESTRCCTQCVIPLGWCQTVFWRMGHGRVVETLASTVGGEGCL